MVQQQVAAAFNGAPQSQVSSIANGAISVDATTHAMPAIINSSNSNNSTSTTIANHSPQSQYSPQASLYQQQLIKSAQHFVGQQQPRLNGLNGTSNLIQQQQYSNGGQQQQQQQITPATNHLFTAASQLQQTESLYNNGQQQVPSRPAPAAYAPKPNYYGQITQQQNNSQIYQQQQQQQQQTAVGGRQVSQLQTSYYAAQHSPISASQTMSQVQQQPQQHQSMALSVRQAPAAVFQGQTVSSLSPSHRQQQQQQMMMIEQQQQQMQQQLVMSYQDQQQQIQQLQASYSLQQPHQQPLMAATLSRHQVLGVAQQAGAWPASQQDLEQQQQLKSAQAAMQQQQPMFHPAVARQLTGGVMASGRTPAVARAGAFSDRDSVSTLSRFNQFDDRRSFTMRSQYTAQPINSVGGKRNSQFGFLELTSEAMRRLLGFSGSQPTTSQRQPLLLGHSADQLQQNLNLAATNEHNNKQQVAGLPSAASQQQQQVTVIDSGEDQQFKRQVFKYQLGIVRLVHLMLSAFVLLSPLAMLLIPKMEPLLRSLESTGPSSGSSSLEYNSQEPPVAPPTSPNVVTHAVGLLDRKHHLATKHQQLAPTAPWHIGECQSSECDGPLIGFVIRLIMLAIAHWAIFFRRQTVTLPRVDFQRCFLISLALLVTGAYWLFFMFRVFDKRHNLELELPYMTIVQFAISMLETLILLHYLALVLVELRRRKKVFCLKVVRSPDGESKYYSAGTLSIQKCAQFVLEKYHRDFGQFDSYREQLLAYEDQLAHHLKRQRQQSQQAAAGVDSSGEQAGGETRQRRSSRRQRSRANSPQSDDEEEPTVDSNQDGEAEDGDETAGEETRGSRRARHHRRPHHHSRRHRSSSRHARDREREEDDDDDEKRPTRSTRTGPGVGEQKRNEREIDVGESSERPRESGSKSQRQAKSNESGDQHESSDNASRMKESSLETIRAAGSNSSDQQATATTTTPSKVDIEISEHPKQQVGGGGRSSRRPEELESVRSARSRRSTGSRMHHRSGRSTRGDHHHSSSSSSRRVDRERSSSRQQHTTIEFESAVRETRGHESTAPVDQMDEHERKLRRRKLRLLAAVEDSFEQIKLLDEAGPPKHHQNTADLNGGIPVTQARPAAGLDAGQTARTLYPNIARALQKYLRLTKQTGRHNLASIYEHLSKCLLYKLSARAFLEKFTNLNPVWQQSETNLFANCRLPADPASQRQQAAFMKHRHQELEINSWSLICDNFLSRQIDSGTFFVLKQGQVSLLVTVARLPHLSLSEQVIDQSQCRFAMRPASGKQEISSV